MTVYIVGGITHGLVATPDVGEVPKMKSKLIFAGFGIGLTVLLLAYNSRAMLSSMDSRREKQLALLDEELKRFEQAPAGGEKPAVVSQSPAKLPSTAEQVAPKVLQGTDAHGGGGGGGGGGESLDAPPGPASREQVQDASNLKAFLESHSPSEEEFPKEHPATRGGSEGPGSDVRLSRLSFLL